MECDDEIIKRVMYNDGLEKGAKGLIDTLLELNMSKDFVIRKLVTKLNITEQKAEEYYSKYSK